jgi:hypothetical protein
MGFDYETWESIQQHREWLGICQMATTSQYNLC